jgi:hypothetical protein
MTFRSILFERTEDNLNTETPEVPAFFVDLNLDQIVEAITAGKQEYNLKPFFYVPLHAIDAIHYRYEIMQALEKPVLHEMIKAFAQKMRVMREHLAQAEKLYYSSQKKAWFLDAVEIYGEAVISLADDLSHVDLQARGLLAFRDYLTGYVQSDRFTTLRSETANLKADLATVRYGLLIKGNSITVRKYESETDYSTEVEAIFEKFKQGAVRDYRVKFSNYANMNHVEARILELVALLYPDIFASLDIYCAKNAAYLDEKLGMFDREIQFYIAYLEHIATLKQVGLKFCYPRMSDTDKSVANAEGFDLALAYKLLKEKSAVVCNDFYLKNPERIIVVTGPNQGGKTTFARTFGQLHYLAALGCPVPGREAQLFLFDQLFTHFEREESIQNLRGKLEDDLVRIHAILKQATPHSLIILNEIFTSTTVNDALFLSKKIMDRIIELDLLGMCVTFLDELAALSEKTVSMVSTVVPENPARRTFKIVRRQADGLAYALSIAEKYRLTFADLQERIPA